MADTSVKKSESRLKKIIEASREKTPEELRQIEVERQQQEEEKLRKEEERRRREGVVKALFDECGTIFGKKRYKARVPQLLEFLKSEKNAIMFWESPHIKKIYDISSLDNFLCSIYVEEMQDETYERWLHQCLANPFNTNYAVNYERISRIAFPFPCNLTGVLDLIFSFCRNTAYVTRSQLIEDIEDYDDDDARQYEEILFLKPRRFGDLLDKNVTISRTVHSNKEELIYFLNPLFITENDFLRLDAYDIWKDTLEDEWAAIEEKVPSMIQLLDELVRTRKIYLKEIEKK